MLALKNVTKRFNRGTVNECVALDDVTLSVREGEFITMIGGNGAGKSTLLNCVAGVFLPDAGQIRIGEADVTRLSEHRRAKYLGRVFQDPMMGTAADMTLEENLALAYRRGRRRTLRWGVTKEERDQYRALLGQLNLGLESRLTTKAGLLSGGQRQALTLLMATLQRPKLLLLDEHTAALDPKTAEKVLAISDAVIREGRLTTLMVTHNMKQALHYGNRLLMLYEGKVLIDVAGEEKKRLTVKDLMALFESASGEALVSDRALLGGR